MAFRLLICWDQDWSLDSGEIIVYSLQGLATKVRDYIGMNAISLMMCINLHFSTLIVLSSFCQPSQRRIPSASCCNNSKSVELVLGL